ncbi:MAG: hypothetical protein JXB00_06940 [Bacteroidales bacterium]|nr:hypothetical protein [Bacteroidales bacterium]
MKRVTSILLFLAAFLQAWPQADHLDSLINDVLGVDKELMRLIDPPSSYCYVYSGINSDTRTFYAGREIGENMVSMNGSAYLLHSKGFYAGLSGMWYSQPIPGYSNTIVSAGLYKTLNKKKSLSFRASYNRYFYSNDTTSQVFSNSLGTGLTLKNSWIGSRLSVNFLFGEDFGFNFTPNIFSRITVVRFGNYNKLQVEPEISLFFGSEYTEYAMVENLSGQQSGSSETRIKEVYGLLNTQFYLPLCVYLGDFDIELGYSLNIPRSQDADISYPVTSFFSFSLGYLLPIN